MRQRRKGQNSLVGTCAVPHNEAPRLHGKG